jgi:hypothetical protein
MADLCVDLRMNLKSEMTSLMYADNEVNHFIHNKIREWFNQLLLSIYSNTEIQSNILQFFVLKKILPWNPESVENMKKFVHDSFALTDLNIEQKKKKENIINGICNTASTTDVSHFFKYTPIFDLFFIIYLKGGMATRFICMLLNTLSDGVMFSPELLQEQLGAVSDYDFNCIINPTFERPVYETFYNLLKKILSTECEKISQTDPFFNSNTIKTHFRKNAQTVANKVPVFFSSGCQLNLKDPLGISSSQEIANLFGLVRLMAQISVGCQGSVCFKDEDKSSVKNTAAVITELIDISIPLFDNIEELHTAWNFGNLAIVVKWCSVILNKCEPIRETNDLLRGKSFKIRRSSGAIEDGWSIRGDVYIYSDSDSMDIVNKDGSVSRKYVIKDILDLNPELGMEKVENSISLTDKLRVYSLHSAIEDLTTTIRESIERGDNSKVEKRKKRLNFFNKLICQYTLLVNTQDSTIKQEDIPKYCIQNVEGLLCPNHYADEDTSLFLAQFSLGSPQDDNLVFSIVLKYCRHILTTKLKNHELLAVFSKDYQNFITRLNPQQLNKYKPLYCNLLYNVLSLDKSLTDDFAIAYVEFLFIWSISISFTDFSLFKNFVYGLTAKFMYDTERIYNNFTRPTIKNFARKIITGIWESIGKLYRPEEGVQILIQGEGAVHLNTSQTYMSLEQMNSNSIDLLINLQRPDISIITDIKKIFSAIWQELIDKNPTWDVKLEFLIMNGGSDIKVILDYSSVVFPPPLRNPEPIIQTTAGPVHLQTLIPRARHQICEINLRTSQSKLYSDDQVKAINVNGKHELVVYKPTYLIKEYNKLLMASKHWYIKSKYLRRIAALTRIITDSTWRRVYESEFELPS